MQKLKSFIFKICIILILLFIFLFLLAKAYSKIMFKQISNNFLRLHIVANSDSTIDQIVKYNIRDNIISYMEPYLVNTTSKEEAIDILNGKLHEIECISNNVLKENNLNYTAKVSIGNYHFPQKEYSNIILPEGNYDSLQIELGNSKGQNWWCIMFPTICLSDFSVPDFSDVDSLEHKSKLDIEEYKLISNNINNNNIHFKFKLIEFFENFK